MVTCKVRDVSCKPGSRPSLFSLVSSTSSLCVHSLVATIPSRSIGLPALSRSWAVTSSVTLGEKKTGSEVTEVFDWMRKNTKAVYGCQYLPRRMDWSSEMKVWSVCLRTSVSSMLTWMHFLQLLACGTASARLTVQSETTADY